MITRPTTYGDHSATLIDNILTNKANGTQLSGIILEELSDHFPIFYVTGDFTVSSRVKYLTQNRRQINDLSLLEFNNKLEDISWEDVRAELDVDKAYDSFFNKFNVFH